MIGPLDFDCEVAPHTGAWIETKTAQAIDALEGRRPSHRGVD